MPATTDAPAFRIDGAAVSARAFYAAACDPARSCVVEACAGSGKTWMLVSRILRALLDGAAPHEILAITFTRKAAGEMRERLDQWLAEHAGPRASHAQRVAALRERGLDAARAETLAPELATLQARVLAAGRPVEIRTFHAWFAQLLRSAPLALLDRARPAGRRRAGRGLGRAPRRGPARLSCGRSARSRAARRSRGADARARPLPAAGLARHDLGQARRVRARRRSRRARDERRRPPHVWPELAALRASGRGARGRRGDASAHSPRARAARRSARVAADGLVAALANEDDARRLSRSPGTRCSRRMKHHVFS